MQHKAVFTEKPGGVAFCDTIQQVGNTNHSAHGQVVRHIYVKQQFYVSGINVRIGPFTGMNEKLAPVLANRVDPEQNYYMTAEYLAECERAVVVPDERLILLGYYKGAYGVGRKVRKYIDQAKESAVSRAEWIHNMTTEQTEELLETILSQYDASARQYVEDIIRRRDRFRDM